MGNNKTNLLCRQIEILYHITTTTIQNKPIFKPVLLHHDYIHKRY